MKKGTTFRMRNVDFSCYLAFGLYFILCIITHTCANVCTQNIVKQNIYFKSLKI